MQNAYYNLSNSIWILVHESMHTHMEWSFWTINILSKYNWLRTLCWHHKSMVLWTEKEPNIGYNKYVVNACGNIIGEL
jgi:hypothetical protein